MKKKTGKNLLLALLAVSLVITPVYGATTKSKISDAKESKSRQQSDLDSTNSRIRSLEEKKGNLEAYLSELNDQLTDLGDDLEEIQDRSEEQQEKLEEVQQELAVAREDKDEQYESMKLRIQYMYENGNSSYFVMLLESEDFTDFLKRADNIMQLAKYDRDMLEKYKETQQTVEEKEADVKEESLEVERLKQETLDQQAEISDLVKSTRSEIDLYTVQISDEQSEAADLLSQVNAQQQIIDDLIKEQKDEEAAQAQQQENNDRKPSGEKPAPEAKPESKPEAKPQPEVKPSNPEPSPDSSQGRYLGKFRITAYCNCPKCGGQGLTASGTVPTAGRTVAMNNIPFGTKLLINGIVYTVEDRGVPYGTVDIYHNTHAEALDFGVMYTDVYQLN